MRGVLVYVLHVRTIEDELTSDYIFHNPTSEIHIVSLTVFYFNVGRVGLIET